MGKTLIAGCGDVGIALGLRLASQGEEVWGLRRHPDRLPAPLRRFAADLTRPESLAGLPDDFEQLVYLTAADEFSDAAYRRAYVDGLDNLLHTLDGRVALRRMIFVSSTGVYAQTNGEWVDETSSAQPRRFSGQRLREGEERALGSGGAATVVRFGGIYGPGRGDLIRRVLAGADCQSDPPLYTNRIHRDDCAGVLHHLLRLEAPAPLYLAVDDEPAPQCVVMGWLAERLGVPAPAHRAADEGQPRGNKRCRNRRLRDSGYRFEYPSYREGYQALLESGDYRRGPP